MKTNMKLRSALVVFITLSGLPRTLHGQGTAPSGGYSAQELQSAISQVSAAVPGARICEIRLLAGGTPPYGLVALTRKGPDWRIVYAEYSSSGVLPKNSAYKDFLDKKVRARPDAP